VIISDALFVPEIESPLHKVKLPIEDIVTFDKFTGRVIDKAGNAALIADWMDDLYFLREANTKCNVALKSKESVDSVASWHRRMEHINARDLVDCAQGGIV